MKKYLFLYLAFTMLLVPVPGVAEDIEDVVIGEEAIRVSPDSGDEITVEAVPRVLTSRILTPRILTIDEAFILALANNESVAIGRESVLQGGFAIDGAYSRIKPEVTLETRYNRYTKEEQSSGFTVQPEDSTTIELRISQPLYSGGKAAALISRAKKRRNAAMVLLEGTRGGVAAAVAISYYNTLRAMKVVEINDASLKRADEQKRVAETRLRVGSATKAEVLRASAEVAGARAELALARADLEDAFAALARVVGVKFSFDLTDGAFTVIEPADPLTPLDLSVDEFIAVALSKRRDMVAKSIEVEMAGDGIDYAKSRFKPDLDLEGVYTYRDQTPKTSFFLEDSAYAGLKLTIPFYDGGERKAVLAEARSKLREAELARGDYRKAVELQVRRAYSKLKSTATVRESYREQVAFARENYDMVFKQYSLGVADNVAVIDAETTLVQAEMGLLGADFDRDLSAVMLMRATGTLLDEVEARSAGITVRYEVDKDESE